MRSLQPAIFVELITHKWFTRQTSHVEGIALGRFQAGGSQRKAYLPLASWAVSWTNFHSNHRSGHWFSYIRWYPCRSHFSSPDYFQRRSWRLRNTWFPDNFLCETPSAQNTQSHTYFPPFSLGMWNVSSVTTLGTITRFSEIRRTGITLAEGVMTWPQYNSLALLRTGLIHAHTVLVSFMETDMLLSILARLKLHDRVIIHDLLSSLIVALHTALRIPSVSVLDYNAGVIDVLEQDWEVASTGMVCFIPVFPLRERSLEKQIIIFCVYTCLSKHPWPECESSPYQRLVTRCLLIAAWTDKLAQQKYSVGWVILTEEFLYSE